MTRYLSAATFLLMTNAITGACILTVNKHSSRVLKPGSRAAGAMSLPALCLADGTMLVPRSDGVPRWTAGKWAHDLMSAVERGDIAADPMTWDPDECAMYSLVWPDYQASRNNMDPFNGKWSSEEVDSERNRLDREKKARERVELRARNQARAATPSNVIYLSDYAK